MKNFISTLLCGLFPLILSAQDGTTILDKISGKLEAFQKVLPLEKVYIQTDKEIYAPGEIIWFGGLVYDRTENQPSEHSQEITVNLYDASGNFIMGDKFPVADGKTNGDLLLPENMKLGHYYIAAYTPLQINPDNVFIKPLMVDRFYESDAVVTFIQPGKIYPAGAKANIELGVCNFYGKPVDKFLLNYEIRHGDKKLADGKIRSESGKAVITAIMPQQTGKDPVELLVSHPQNLWTKKMAIKTSADEIGMNFYVEGGTMLGAVVQKTGFYATSWNGTPVDLEADITDPSGQVITKTKTFSPGFGLFPFKANPGEKYKLTITSEHGKGQSFDIPGTGMTPGLALTVPKTDNEFITADLLVSDNNHRKLAITATRGYKLLWAANTEVSGNSRIKIPVSDLGKGVVLLSVFDDTGTLQSSRLVFVPEKNKMELGISNINTQDEKLKITLSAKDEKAQPIPATVFLSVADTMRKADIGNRYTGWVNLNGELKNPSAEAGMFLDDFGIKGNAVDYILICNELKCFSWNKIMNYTGDKTGAVPLSNTGISGRVTDKKGNPVPNAKISIMNSRDMQLYSIKADGKGMFRYPSLQPVDIHDFTVSATDENGRGSYNVATDPTFSEKVGSKVKATDYRFSGWEAPRHIAGYLASNPGLLYEQPVIKQASAEKERPRTEIYKTLLMSGSSLLDVIRTMKPFTLVSNQIVFYGTVNSINAQSGALIVIDGQKMGTTVDALNNISPVDVDKINISLDPMDIQRYTGLNNVGIIEITTKRGEAPAAAEAAPQKENLYRDGYRIPRNFLTTDALRGEGGKNLRTTLYWNPNLVIGPSGTITFSIPLSAIKSGFVISAEGISPTGQIGQTQQVINIQ